MPRPSRNDANIVAHAFSEFQVIADHSRKMDGPDTKNGPVNSQIPEEPTAIEYQPFATVHFSMLLFGTDHMVSMALSTPKARRL